MDKSYKLYICLLTLLLSVSCVNAQETLGAFYFVTDNSLSGNKGTGVQNISLIPNHTTISSTKTPLERGEIDDGTFLVQDGVLYLDRKDWKSAAGQNIWHKTELNQTGPFLISITADEDHDLEIHTFSLTQVSSMKKFESDGSIFFVLHEDGSALRSDQASVAAGKTRTANAHFDIEKYNSENVKIQAGQTKVFNLRFNTNKMDSQHILDNFLIKGIATKVK